MCLKFSPITLFPEMFQSLLLEGVISRGIEKELLSIEPLFLRNFAEDARRNVDDHPIGGGDGMVLKPEIIHKAISSCKTENSTTIFLSPQGSLLTNTLAKKLAQKSHLILLCGRYAGFDHRTLQEYADEEISIGDYILSGGELPAMVLIDTVSRFIPGVLGNQESSQKDSFENGLLEPPVYTKPLEYHGKKVPEILLSGNHQGIKKYLRKEQIRVTALKRPDLIFKEWDHLTLSEQKYAEHIFKTPKTYENESSSF